MLLHFVVCLQSHAFVTFTSYHMQLATWQVRLASLTYFQLLFPAPTLIWNLTRNRLKPYYISNMHSLWLHLWTTYLFLSEYAVNYQLHGDLMAPHQTWQIDSPRLSHFSTNGISLYSGKAEMKTLQRSRQAHFLGTSSPHTFLPDPFALHAALHVTQVKACGLYQGFQ